VRRTRVRRDLRRRRQSWVPHLGHTRAPVAASIRPSTARS